MSKISKMFSGSKSSSSSTSKSKHRSRGQLPTPREAIDKLRETETMLTRKQEFLERKIDEEIAIARKNGTRNKRAALQALKRKKRYEQQLTQIDGTLSTIEFQREALENSNMNTEVLKNMGYAAKAMKKVHETIDMDKIDTLMGDIQEQQDLSKEISDAISRPFGDEFDEDELLAELAELEMEENSKQMAKLPSAPSIRLPNERSSASSGRLPSERSSASSGRLPSASSGRLPSERSSHRNPSRKRVEDDADMKRLASWAV